jgi:hypothetical protein
MAVIPNDTRFIGINPTVDLRERRSARINRETQPVSMQDITDSIRPYKVYTALLTQNGTSSTVNATSGLLIVGVSYLIDVYNAGDDFSNVGGPAAGLQGEWDGYSFLATGTTPNNWNNLSGLSYNEGTPVATVLENTIGNIWFEYDSEGLYRCKSNGLFTENKTIIDMDAYCQNGNPTANLIYKDLDTGVFIIGTYKDPFGDGYLSNNRLEIRVYN